VTDVGARDSASILLTAAPVAVVSPVTGAALILLGTVVMMSRRWYSGTTASFCA